jgi:hypothetical protein
MVPHADDDYLHAPHMYSIDQVGSTMCSFETNVHMSLGTDVMMVKGACPASSKYIV